MRSKKETKKTSAKKLAETKAKTHRRKCMAKKDIIAEDEKEDNEQNIAVEDFNSSVDTSFFYTNDKRLNAIDDLEVVNKITEKYPDFNQKTKDTQLKKTFLQVLEDEKFISDVLEYFSLSILDFFKIIYKNYSSLFNTLFIKKVRDKIKNKKYARV